MKARRLRGHADAVLCCIASPARPAVVVSAGEDGRICCFDLRCKDAVLTLHVGEEPVSSICFKPGNEDAVYASCGTQIKCFDLNMASPGHIFESYNYNRDEINQISFSSKSPFLASADDSGDVKVIDTRQKCLYKTLRAAHENICSGVQFLPWRQWEVVTGGLDAKLVIWEFSRGRRQKTIDFGKHDASPFNNSRTTSQSINPPFVHSIAVAKEDTEGGSQHLCAVARGDGVIEIIDIEYELYAVKGSNASRSRKQALSRNDKGLRETSEGSSSSQVKRFQLEGHTSAASCIEFAEFGERGRFMVSGGNDALVKVWNLAKHGDAEKNDPNLHLSINVQRKVNWVCSTPGNSENLIVCDTSKTMKVYTVA